MKPWILILLLVLSSTGCKTSQNKSFALNVDGEDSSFEVYFHRLSGRDGKLPENSLAGLVETLKTINQFGQRKIDGQLVSAHLELDVQWIDGQLLVYHDATINPKILNTVGNDTSGEELTKLGFQKIRSLEFLNAVNIPSVTNPEDPLDVLRCSKNIPTLGEVFEVLKRFEDRQGVKPYLQPNLNIEYKNPPKDPQEQIAFINALYRKVQEYNLSHRVILQSFDDSILRRSVAVFGDGSSATPVKHSFLWGKKTDQVKGYLAYPFVKEDQYFTKSEGRDFFSPHESWVTQGEINNAKKSGIKLLPWTVNSVERALELKKMGAAGVISDHAAEILEALSGGN